MEGQKATSSTEVAMDIAAPVAEAAYVRLLSAAKAAFLREI